MLCQFDASARLHTTTDVSDYSDRWKRFIVTIVEWQVWGANINMHFRNHFSKTLLIAREEFFREVALPH